ncbi:MAG: hypothetical protein GXP62_07865 [Oligoflexia bacterium]|nr:hypothetical protein [Oligoflexia bacterium]
MSVLMFSMWLSLAISPACKPKASDTGKTSATSTDGGTTPAGYDFDVDDGDLSDVSGAVSDVIPTVVSLSWTSPVEGDGYVESALDGGDWVATPVQSTGTSHQAVVLGLKAGRSYDLHAITKASDGTIYQSGDVTVDLDPAPADLSRFSLTIDERDLQRPGGYILTSQLQASDNFMVIIDRDGDVVWYYRAPAGLSVPTPKPARDGVSLLFNVNDKNQIEDVGRIIRVAMDGSYTTETRTLTGHHAFVELPDNRFAWIGLDQRTVPATWRKDGDSTQDITGQDWYLTGDVIYEIDEGATDADTPTEIFNFFDDYPVDPYWMCQHASAYEYGLDSFDWTHSNSLMYVDSQDDLYLMSKNLDSLFRIDRSTGDIVWRIGDSLRGAEFDDVSDFTTPTEGSWWSHGHMSQLWDGGMVVFDNGYHHDPTTSRVMAYSWDEDTKKLTVDWQYKDPQGRFIQLLGDGRWLDNGNYLTAWTSSGIVSEITPDGQVVWQVELEVGARGPHHLARRPLRPDPRRDALRDAGSPEPQWDTCTPLGSWDLGRRHPSSSTRCPCAAPLAVGTRHANKAL